MVPMRIYVAGQLSNKRGTDKRTTTKVVTDYIQNVHKLCQAASRLRRRGHYPYLPGLDLLLGLVVGDWEEDEYRELGMEFLEVCDAVLVISWSSGVDAEVRMARDLNIPVYVSEEEVPDE